MNKKEIIEEVVVSASASTSTNNTLSAASASGSGSTQSIVRQKISRVKSIRSILVN